jgi:hypothetical protein
MDSIRTWYVSLGLPIACVPIGISIAMTGVTYFCYGIILAYAGIGWLCIDWWIYSKKFTALVKLIGYIVPSIFFAFVSFIAFRQAPLGILPISLESNYPDGLVTPLRACGPAGGSVAKGMKKSAIAATAFRQRSSSRRSGSISGSH